MNTRWSKGSAAKACAAATAPPHTATSSSAKQSASRARTASVVRGVYSDILISARLPAASAAISGPSARYTGKFHGAMMPTTPFGWYIT